MTFAAGFPPPPNPSRRSTRAAAHMTVENEMSEQPKFTPGPWRVLNDDAIKVAAKDGSLATVTHIHLRGRRDTNEVEANAHLIAAAPKMADYVKRKADEGCEEAARIWGQINAS